jgi:hypothetical protein
MSPQTRSSSSRTASGKWRLIARADDPTVEVFIINSALNVIKRGVEEVEAVVAPGVYKVKFSASSYGGALEQEHLVLVDQDRLVSASEQLPASPIPLRGFRNNFEFQSHNASAQSRLTARQVGLGTGSSLFVFVRDLFGGESGNPLDGTSLHPVASDALPIDLAMEGRIIRDYGFRPGRDASAAGCHLALAPGAYCLRVAHPRGQVTEQVVVTCKGWQTQVFLARDQRKEADGGIVPYIDVANASMLMSHADLGFDNRSPMLRITERVRLALADKRIAVGSHLLGMHKWWQENSPLLALYSAQLALLAQAPSAPPIPNLAQIENVVVQLRGLLGDSHPDVRALAHGVASARGLPPARAPFAVPPMLDRSWQLVRTTPDPLEIPAGSLAARVAGLEWRGTMWVIWDEVPLRHRVEAQAVDLSRSAELVERLRLRENAPRMLKTQLRSEMDPIEADVVAYLHKAVRRPLALPRHAVESTERAGASLSSADLLKAMRLPLASVQMALGRLLHSTRRPYAHLDLPPTEDIQEETSEASATVEDLVTFDESSQ